MEERAEAVAAAPGAVRRPVALLVGGPDVHLRLDLMDRLTARYEVIAAGSDPSLAPRFEARGYDFHGYSLPRGAHPVGDLRALRRLEILMRILRPNVVHAFATKPAVWGRIAAHRAGVPVIVGTIPGLGELYARADLPTRFLRVLYERLQRRACAVSGATIFQNEEDREELIRRDVVDRESSLVIPGSGVDTEFFDPSRVELSRRRRIRVNLGVPEDATVAILVSRLVRSKGILDFAEAARICATDSSLRFVLVGPEDRTSRHGLSETDMASVRKHTLWLEERSDVRDLLAAADIFVFPSYYREGVPRVLLEAGAMRLPLVAVRTTGSTDVVRHAVTGYLCESRDPAALAAAVRALAADRNLRRSLGDAARSHVVARFAIDIISAATLDLYDMLLEKVPPSLARRDRRPATRRYRATVRRLNHRTEG